MLHVLLSLLAAVPFACGHQTPSAVRINYIPFGAESPYAITTETIAAKGPHGPLTPEDAAIVRSIISAARGSKTAARFDGMMVRMRIVDEGPRSTRTAFVDHQGIVISEGKTGQLSAAEQAALARVIRKYAPRPQGWKGEWPLSEEAIDRLLEEDKLP